MPEPVGLNVEAAMAEAEALEAAAAAAEARLAAAQARAAVTAARARATAAALAAKAKARPAPEQPLVTVPDQPLMTFPYQPLVAMPDQPPVAVPGGDEEELATTDGVPVRLQWLNAAAQRAVADGTRTVGECIGTGDVLVSLGGVASEAELEALLHSGLDACEAQRQRTGREPPPGGKDRFSVSDPLAFDSEVVLGCEELLLRVLDRVDEQLPSVYESLFAPSEGWLDRQPLTAAGQPPTASPPEHLQDACPSLRDLYMAGELEWSEGEPAINVYTAGGYPRSCKILTPTLALTPTPNLTPTLTRTPTLTLHQGGGFGAHKDHMALTFILPLTCPTRGFSGGGTGFWSAEAEAVGSYGGGRDEADMLDDNKANARPDGPPTAILRPPLGTAILFGGDVTHAGMPVEDGTRAVLVASFSTRTPASSEARVNGLRASSASSALREYSF